MKKVVSLFLLLVMLLSSVIPACAATSAQETYEEAQQLLSEKQYDQAKQAFESLGAYQEATKYAMYIEALNEAEGGFFDLASLNFSALGDFLDSSLRASYYSARSLESNLNYEEAGSVYLSIIAFMDSGDRYTALPELILARDYAKADLLESKGLLEDARDAFSKLGTYKDSPERVSILEEKIKARDYEKADKLEQQNKLEEALKAFIALADYSDSAERAEAIREKSRERNYGKAIALEQENQYSAAYKAFTALGDYKDSKDRAAALHDQAMYDDAMELADKGQYSKAAKIFASLGSYQDSEDKAYVLGVADFAEETTDPVDGVFVFKHHGVYGISNYHDNVARPAIYDSINQFRYGVAAYCLNNKWGLVYPDLSTTPAEWKEIGTFTNVQDKILAEVVRNGKHGYIDTAGNVVLSVDWYDVSTFNSDGVCYLVSKRESNYYYGLADYRGNVIVEPEYTQLGNADDITYYYAYKTNLTAPQAGNQLMVIRKDNQYGFMTDSGYIITPEYDAVYPFSEDLAAVQKDGLWGFINKDGKYVIEPEYLSVTSFFNGKADVLVKDNGWHIIDKENRRIYFTTQGIETADNLMAAGEYEKAAELYESMSGIDPTLHEKAQKAWYKAAEEKYIHEDYEGAIILFSKIPDYNDSAEQVLKSHYALAEKAIVAGDWDIASEEFIKAGNYSDAEARILEPYYAQAESLLAGGDYNGAIQAFGKVEGYSDSAERILEIHYILAEQAMEANDWVLASSEFALANGYNDAYIKLLGVDIQKAKALLANGEYDQAYEIISSYMYFKDAYNLILEDETLNKIYKAKQLEAISTIGAHVYFGSYEFDHNESNGPEPIEWEIIDIDGDKAMLLSTYVLDEQKYHDQGKDITWEKCALRKWLNKDFYNSAFSDSEKACILSTNVVNKNANDKKTGGNTKDNVYLLNQEEVDKYVGKTKEAKIGKTPPVVTETGIQESEESTWWLRQRAKDRIFDTYTLVVTKKGVIDGTYPTVSCGIRPVIWISIKKFAAN